MKQAWIKKTLVNRTHHSCDTKNTKSNESKVLEVFSKKKKKLKTVKDLNFHNPTSVTLENSQNGFENAFFYMHTPECVNSSAKLRRG